MNKLYSQNEYKTLTRFANFLKPRAKSMIGVNSLLRLYDLRPSLAI